MPLRDGEKPGAEWVGVWLTRWQSGEYVLCWRRSDYVPSCPTRGPCQPDSHKAMTRLRRFTENSIAEWQTMVTLTYPAAWPDMRASKEHLRAFMRWLMVPRGTWEPTSAIWVLEWQRRGAPHYHIVVDAAFRPHQVIAKAWRRATDGIASLSSGTRIEQLRGNRLEIAKYLAKELAKTYQRSHTGWCGETWGICGSEGVRPVEAVTMDLPRSAVMNMVWLHPVVRLRVVGNGFVWSHHTPADAIPRTMDAIAPAWRSIPMWKHYDRDDG